MGIGFIALVLFLYLLTGEAVIDSLVGLLTSKLVILPVQAIFLFAQLWAAVHWYLAKEKRPE